MLSYTGYGMLLWDVGACGLVTISKTLRWQLTTQICNVEIAGGFFWAWLAKVYAGEPISMTPPAPIRSRRPSTSFVLVTNRASPAKTLPELIAYANANPGKLNVGVGGNGTLLHMATELFKMMAGVNLTNVLYCGDGPALTDLLGG